MTKIKTAELTDLALDYATAQALQYDLDPLPTIRDAVIVLVGGIVGGVRRYRFSLKNPRDVVALLENGGMVTGPHRGSAGKFVAYLSAGPGRHREEHSHLGETIGEAAGRCYVSSRFGPEIDIPEELLP